MAEYWNIAPERQDFVESFFKDSPEPEVSLEFIITEKDFNTAGKGSAEIKNLLKRLGIDSEILRRVAVASYEAEINVAAHSVGGRMTSNVYDELIHIRFEDNGPGIADIAQAMTPGFSTADDLVREMGFGAGLGLPNIKKNSDMLHIVSERGKNTVLELMIFFG
jgi:anti-sigma regulatory factor (Ser/Thr protein kinase)